MQHWTKQPSRSSCRMCRSIQNRVIWCAERCSSKLQMAIDLLFLVLLASTTSFNVIKCTNRNQGNFAHSLFCSDSFAHQCDFQISQQIYPPPSRRHLGNAHLECLLSCALLIHARSPPVRIFKGWNAGATSAVVATRSSSWMIERSPLYVNRS